MSDADANWLGDVVVVNESNDLRIAGDVSIFRTAWAACRYLEPWWVADHEGFALNGLGQQVILGVHNDQVIIERVCAVEEGPNILHSWLTADAEAVFQARLTRAQKGKLSLGQVEAQHILPCSIEGLIAYIGLKD